MKTKGLIILAASLTVVAPSWAWPQTTPSFMAKPTRGQLPITEWEEVPPLVTALWGQAYPYNSLVPGGEENLVGCVSLTMGQVMRYHQWPAKGDGSISYSIKDPGFYDGIVEVDFNEITFDWENMPDAIAKSSPEVRIKAISNLLKATGASVYMSYSPEVSLAYSQMEAPALYKYFNYSDLMKHVQADYYSPGEWTWMVYNQLSQGIPLIYGGTGDYGHSFICDGFRMENDEPYFHINWGWNGRANGYYTLDHLRPQTGFQEGTFNRDIEMVINLVKPGTEVQNVEKEPLLYSVDDFIIRETSEVKLGSLSPELFSEKGGVKNTGVKDVNGTVGFLFTHNETGKRYLCYETSDRTIKIAEFRGNLSTGFQYRENNTGSIKIQLPSVMEYGEYTGVPIFRPEGSDSYLRVICPIAGQTSVKMTVDGDRAVFSPGQTRLSAYNITSTAEPGDEELAEISCTVYNPGRMEVETALGVRLVNENGEVVNVYDENAIYPESGEIALKSKSEVTVTFGDILYAPEILTPGNYSIEIYDTATGIPLGLTRVTEPLFDPALTGSVESIEADQPERIYNLQGLPVRKDRMDKGIYIINGRKVLIK